MWKNRSKANATYKLIMMKEKMTFSAILAPRYSGSFKSRSTRYCIAPFSTTHSSHHIYHWCQLTTKKKTIRWLPSPLALMSLDRSKFSRLVLVMTLTCIALHKACPLHQICLERTSMSWWHGECLRTWKYVLWEVFVQSCKCSYTVKCQDVCSKSQHMKTIMTTSKCDVHVEKSSDQHIPSWNFFLCTVAITHRLVLAQHQTSTSFYLSTALCILLNI